MEHMGELPLQVEQYPNSLECNVLGSIDMEKPLHFCYDNSIRKGGCDDGN